MEEVEVKKKNKTIFQKTKSMLTKFMVVGMVGMCLTSVVGNMGKVTDFYHSNALTEAQRTEIHQIADTVKGIGLDGFDLKIQATNGSKDLYNSFATQVHLDNSCTINIFVANKNTVDLKSSIDMNNTTSAELDSLTKVSVNAQGAMAKFAFSHELGHCDQAVKEKLQDFGNADFNKLFNSVENGRISLNNTFDDYLGGERSVTNLNKFLEESYAESMALIMMTKGSNVDGVNEVLAKRELSNLFTRAGQNAENELKSHDFSYLSDYAKSSDFKEKAANANSLDEIRTLAVEMAQDNFKQVMSSKNIDNLFNAQINKREAIQGLKGQLLFEVSGEKSTEGLSFAKGPWAEMVNELRNSLSPELLQEFKEAVTMEVRQGLENLSRDGYSKVAKAYHDVYNNSPELVSGLSEINQLRDGIKDLVKDVQTSDVLKIKISADNLTSQPVFQEVLKINKEVIEKNKNSEKFSELSENNVKQIKKSM